MTITYAQILILIIIIFGIVGWFRGVRAAALTTAAIFFGIVVIVFSAGLIVSGLQRLGVPLAGADTQAIFTIVLFIFVVAMASPVLRRIVGVTTQGLPRSHRLWGILLGLFNGFLIMAVIGHYIVTAVEASARPGTATLVGVPALQFNHPTPDTWSVSLVSSSLTFLPPAPNGDLWAKLPVALLLLVLFLAVVFVGTVYSRVVRGRGRG